MTFPLTKTSFGTYQRYLSALVGNNAYEAPSLSFDLLATEQLTAANTGTYTFTGLVDSYAADYTHLQVRMLCRGNNPNNNLGSSFVNFNNVTTGSSYNWHTIHGDGSSASVSTNNSQSEIKFGSWYTKVNDTAGRYGSAIMTIYNAFSTSLYKTVSSTTVGISTGGTEVGLQFGLWQNTNAIDQIELDDGTNSWAAGTRFSLYGWKA